MATDIVVDGEIKEREKGYRKKENCEVETEKT